MTVGDFFRPVRVRSLQLSHRLACLCLLVVSLAMFIPGFVSVPPIDRDEPRFAQASKQMLENDDFVSIRYQFEARNKKPVGIYWMQAGVVALAQQLGVPEARTRIWLYRIPSLVGAIATVLLTYWAALALGTSSSAFLAALLMAATLLLGVEARLAKTDAVVAATVVAAMGVLARIWMQHVARRDWLKPAIFWTAIGIGLLVKGPITPMVPLFAAIALSVTIRSAGWLRATRPIPGLIWCGVMVTPWLVLIMQSTHGAFLTDAIVGDMFEKVTAAQELHGAPPGTYAVAFLLTGWPLSPFALLALPFVWRERRDPAVAFLLAWIVPAWILFELVPTKLPHYVLPVYPAIAMLSALAIDRKALELRGRLAAFACWLLPAVPLLLLLASCAIAIYFRIFPGALFIVFSAVLLWQLVGLVGIIRDRDRDGLLSVMPIVAVLTYAMVWPGVLGGPLFAPFDLSDRLAQERQRALGETPGCARLEAATTRYREPSLVFLLGTDLILTTPDDAAAFLLEEPCRIAFVTAPEEHIFQLAGGDDPAILPLARVTGVSLNRGPLDIGVYLRQGKAHESPRTP